MHGSEEDQQGAAMQRKGLSMGCLIAKSRLCNSIPPNGEAIPRGGLLVKVVQSSLSIFCPTKTQCPHL